MALVRTRLKSPVSGSSELILSRNGQFVYELSTRTANHLARVVARGVLADDLIRSDMTGKLGTLSVADACSL